MACSHCKLHVAYRHALTFTIQRWFTCAKMATARTGVHFDSRPVKVVDSPLPSCYSATALAKFAAANLKANGYCVLDGVMQTAHCDGIIQEVQMLERAGLFSHGQLTAGRSGGDHSQSKERIRTDIRSDQIVWLQGTEEGPYPHITRLVQGMDEIIMFYHP